jgi:hypothetical protein
MQGNSTLTVMGTLSATNIYVVPNTPGVYEALPRLIVPGGVITSANWFLLGVRASRSLDPGNDADNTLIVYSESGRDPEVRV